MNPSPVRYRSPDEDSGRWLDFEFRPGDIVISTRSKSGTTWMQMICALLVFRTPELPRPLSDLSPWLDWLGTPRDEVCRQLELQTHRRFIKSHTPLDGLPLDDRATFLVVTDAWTRRHKRNIELAHYDDLLSDLPGEMKRLAGALGMDIDPDLIEDLAAAASFDAMKKRSELLAPDPAGILRDRSRFFRQGRSGSAAEVLTSDDMATYLDRAAELAPGDLIEWLHRRPPQATALRPEI